MLLKLAWRNIWRNKRRTWITASSIILAVLFVVLMRALQLGTYDHMIENVALSYTGYIQVHQDGYWDEKNLNNSMERDSALLEKVRGVPGVRAAVPRLSSFSLASHGNLTKGAMVLGIDPEAEKAVIDPPSKLVQGESLDQGDEAILIGQGVADHFGIGVGDTLVFLGQGYHGRSAAGKYPVNGILDLNAPDLNKRLVLLPLKAAQWYYGTRDRVTALSLVVDNRRDVPVVQERLREDLDPEQYEVMGWRQMLPELVQTIQFDNAGGIIMAIILYMVIAFGVFGTVLMMTEERKREFGILVSVGMRKGKLAIVLWMESIMIALLGVVIGMLLAYPLIVYFHYDPIRLTGGMAKAVENFGFQPVLPTTLDPSVITANASIVLAIAAAIGLYPALRIARLQPVKAMRG